MFSTQQTTPLHGLQCTVKDLTAPELDEHLQMQASKATNGLKDDLKKRKDSYLISLQGIVDN